MYQVFKKNKPYDDFSLKNTENFQLNTEDIWSQANTLNLL